MIYNELKTHLIGNFGITFAIYFYCMEDYQSIKLSLFLKKVFRKEGGINGGKEKQCKKPSDGQFQTGK